MTHLLLFLLFLFSSTTLFAEKIVNVYVWGGVIPKNLIQEFERDTGITVHFSTYDSNETMYAKLKASSNPIYDVILPSGYYVERMRNQGMLTPLDHHLLPNLTNLDHRFQNNDYDPNNHYSVPLTWGATGIFYNQLLVLGNPPKAWQALWQKRWYKQLMLLDDAREVFSIALLSLGFDPNDRDPQHIKKAYLHLLDLVPNIKLFASDSIQALMIDEDAIAGVAWNADAFKAQSENKEIRFIYPEEGFVIWVDCLAIPKNPPHMEEAYAFINYMLRPESSVSIALLEGASITNAKGLSLLPKAISENPVIYPPEQVLDLGRHQRDVGEKTLALYSQYWQQLKLAF